MIGGPRKRAADEMEEDAQTWQEYICSSPKTGKWSAEEENYANQLIHEFEAGTLVDCADGCTLRAYLSKKLNCAPMRISKKYAGKSIGKLSYVRKVFNEREAHDAHVYRQRSTSSCNSDASRSGTLDEQDPIIQARRADVSFRTLAEFQTYQHIPGVVQYLHQPIAMMCVQPDGRPRPTLLYPMTYCASTQSWTTTVTQRPGDFEHPIGLDIDDLHQRPHPGAANMYGYAHYEVHSVSTDSTYSSTSSVASSTDCFLASASERYVQVGGPCRTPEVSPNLVSPVQLSVVSNTTATVLSLQQPSTPARGRCPSEEAEEWHEVLAYFTSSQRNDAHGAASGQRAGQQKNNHHVCTPGDEAGKVLPPSKHDLPLPRNESSFMLGRNGSFSSLFL